MTARAAPEPTLAYLALGDSYTIGEGAPRAARWPGQLAAALRARGWSLARTTYVARTGWTTAELLAALAVRPGLEVNYALVSLLIGVNNQYRGQSLARYRREFRQLLALARHHAGGHAGRVLVLSIPDWGQAPFAQAEGKDAARIGAAIDRFNAGARAECRAAGIAWVDITDLTRAAAGDARQFTADGLHYTGRQMRRWAERALPVVQRLLW